MIFTLLQILCALRATPKGELREAVWHDMTTPFKKCLVLVVGVWALLGCGDGAVVWLLLWLAFGKKPGDEYTNKF